MVKCLLLNALVVGIHSAQIHPSGRAKKDKNGHWIEKIAIGA